MNRLTAEVLPRPFPVNVAAFGSQQSSHFNQGKVHITVADPGFSPGGANSQSGCADLFFGPKLHENERI